MRNQLKAFALTLSGIAILLGGCQAQRTFKSPDDAVAALEDAVKRKDKNELHRIFGPNVEQLKSGDPEQDRQDAILFARRLEAGHKIEQNGPGRATLLIGQEQWPFAVLLVKTGSAWKFDTDAGLDELTSRRIGRNELQTIAACRTVIDAQKEFFQRDPDGVGVKHYAQRLMSHEGEKDGLYWPAPGGVDPSPIGPALAFAATRRDVQGERIPFNGYLFKPLYRQAATAPGGAMDYMQDGKLTKGWAVLAYPAEYGKTGIMSFLVGSGGAVYQKDLGDDTDKDIDSIDEFDPSDGWNLVSQ